MAVLRKNKTSNYTVIDNNVFKNKELSLKAKGLLCQMLSLPDNWEYSLNGLVSLSTDGISSVRAALQELENQHYFSRHRLHKNGKLAGVEYIISETPMCENLILENQILENQILENQPQLNTNNNKIKKESNKKRIYKDVIDYLNQRLGTSYKCTAGYIKGLIDARVNDGATLDDFKIVIDKKADEWIGTDMAKYLRPQTLFGTKFESYLNQPANKSNLQKAFDVIDQFGQEGDQHGYW